MPVSARNIKKLRNVATAACYVNIDSLKPASWNPAIRIQLQYLHDLRESIASEGFWEFSPILCDRNGTIIDGHRRWTASKMLNLTEVPVVIVDADADELWSKFNGTRMNVSGAQSLQAIAGGMKSRPPKYADMLSRLETVIGIEGLQKLAQMGKSPHIINQGVRIARYLGLEDDNIFIGNTVFWLAKHARMNNITTKAIREDIDPSIIERAIRADRPLTADWH